MGKWVEILNAKVEPRFFFFFSFLIILKDAPLPCGHFGGIISLIAVQLHP